MPDTNSLPTALKNGKLYLAVMGDGEIAARALQVAQTPKFSDEL